MPALPGDLGQPLGDRLGPVGGQVMKRRRDVQARGLALQGAPTWKVIAAGADEHDARLIVLGSHGRSGLSDVLVGSVAAAVASHSRRSVLIAHRGS